MGLRLEEACKVCVSTIREMSRISFESVFEGAPQKEDQLQTFRKDLRDHVQKIENFMILEEFLYLLIIAIGQHAYEIEGDNQRHVTALERVLDPEYIPGADTGDWEARRILYALKDVKLKNLWSTHVMVPEGEELRQVLEEVSRFGLEHEQCRVKSESDLEERALQDGFERLHDNHTSECNDDPEEPDFCCLVVKGTSAAIASWILHRHTPLFWVDRMLLEELRLEGPLGLKA